MALLRDTALLIPQLRRLHDARNALLVERDSLAGQVASGKSPFFHYNSRFDPLEVIRRHAVHGLQADPKHFTNFLGVRINPRFLPEVLQGTAGQLDGIPIPANWHADIAEWGAALRGVDLASGTFTAIELGCGWGCWINNTGLAARHRGLNVHLIGVEGDEGHVAFAKEACATNGFAESEVTLHRGIAASVPGHALFPRQARAGVEWGLQPIIGATEEQRQNATRSGAYDELPMITLDQLAEPFPRIDLLHIDIQGGEADLIEGSMRTLCDKVAYMVVGTHSRQIEGRIFETLLGDTWLLEIERPAILALNSDGPHVSVDGVQGWRNSKLTAGR